MYVQVFNCSAPDTGNMEVLVKYGTEQQKVRLTVYIITGKYTHVRYRSLVQYRTLLERYLNGTKTVPKLYTKCTNHVVSTL